MDLAFDGEARNLEVVVGDRLAPRAVSRRRAACATPTRSEALFAAGATRVVLGSAALADESRRDGARCRRRDRASSIGIEVDDGRIRSRGRDPVDLPLMETLGWLVAAGAPAFLVTSVAGWGVEAVPTSELVKRVVRAGRPVLAAGGIASIDGPPGPPGGRRRGRGRRESRARGLARPRGSDRRAPEAESTDV